MDKLELQSVCYEKIKTLCVNYSKDSASRKNAEYLNKRFSSLESLWKEFDSRHALLILELEDKTLNYFADDVYERTKKMYFSTTSDITKRLSDLEKRSQVTFDLVGTDIQLNNGDDNSQLLLQKQECNINALYRTMAKISSKPISEQWQLDDNLATLQSKWVPVDKLHSEIDFKLKGSNEQYYEMFLEVEQKYDELKSKLNDQIWSTAHFKKSAPKIEIPEFAGGYNQWISFKDLFLETIDKNPTINNAQKMHHLKTKLRGEAESIVQHLPVSSENYSSCWDILVQRYDNRRRLFTSYLNTMLDLPNIQHPDSFNLKKMHDVITECLNGMSNIGVDLTTSDPVIAHLMCLKLDDKTMDNYVKEIQDKRELPNSQEFLSFLEKEFMGYETKRCAKKSIPSIQHKASNNKYTKQMPEKKSNFNTKRTYNYYVVHTKCPLCNENHVLRQCDKFLEFDIVKRNTTVSKLQLCKNCLYRHENNRCNSIKTCKECNKRHHTLLHNPDWKFPTTNFPYKKNNMSQQPSTSQQPASNHLSTNTVQVLLTTVQLKVKCVDGTYVKLRALLDQGSQVNLITENAAQILKLSRTRINACITGIGAVSGDCKGQLTLSCQSVHSDFCFDMQALIMKKLTTNLPTTSFEKTEWPHLQNLKLADPDFNISRPVDLLLGADVYSEIILDGVLKGKNDSPVAQQTHIGWILCGKMNTFNCHVTTINLEELTKFWETEDIQTSKSFSKDDQCEQFYKETVQRSNDGKYIVKMPMYPDFEQKLGNSKSIAISQYLQLEKRLNNKPKLLAMYRQFIEEYAALGHMKLSSPITKKISCYLPHHGVMRENSLTTKLRVVFNASQKNTNGYSLNNLMEKGGSLQKDIQALILKWRTYKYVFTADVEKMYRCIWISEEQQHLQKIIWRNSNDEPLHEYQLTTVTYGTKSAPWLAMRTLRQLAEDDGHKYPEAAQTLRTECYVDDVISGHNDKEKAIYLQQTLIQLLRGGGMNLRKWTSNHPALLENLSQDQISTQLNYDFKAEESTKTLGIGWNPNTDTFYFNWPITNSKRLTKRLLLSNISKFYDPLGWLSPITVSAKLLFQKLWMSKLSWDDEVPNEIEIEWLKLKNELPYITKIQINRWIGDLKQHSIELLGFCDASEKAYACVIYTKILNIQGEPITTLLVARTRVAPLQQKTTLPRLELCGALLLAELIDKVKNALLEYKVTVQAWSDSQVVLAWIKGDSSRWETYIANRVTKIKRSIPADKWSYVKSEQNPADCASRGLLPSKLIDYNLWWQGPEFLRMVTPTEVHASTYQTTLGCIYNAEKKRKLSSHNEDNIMITTLLNKYSCLTRIIRIVAWVRRFVTNTRNKTKYDTPYLTTSELSAANIILIIELQRSEFNSEYNQLLKNENFIKKSSISKLCPYLDESGLMRVGGRLKNSNLPVNMKNPVIIPHNGRFTQLLIEQSHSYTLHGGARLTLTHIRQRYWIVGGNRAVKNILRKCVRCHRYNKSDNYQLMGDLPKQRVTPCRPFTHTGVDFSGHVDVKHNKGRGVKTSKGYIAIFICMATKAVHIELVSDLSTETFLAAFQRLCARRGMPKHMYSDCGTNFIGAAKVLKHEFKSFQQLLTPAFFTELATLEVEWHFNAPAWPSAGGLWEAAVKSMKHHLRRVLGDQKLTYEEFTTLLTKIEACLNSRPLCPLTEDPEEFYNCLTPGHFLTGSPILSLPQADYNNIENIDLRRRWQLIEHMFSQYWKNWSSEYLSILQTRSKWTKPTRNIKEGDIVLVKENNLPPGKWALGRVLQTHPGTDGYVRVTTIKTQAGIIKRPVVKLSPLPLQSEIEDNNQDSTTKLTTNTKKRKGFISSILISLLTLFTIISGSHCYIEGTRQVRTAVGAHITSLEHERPIYYDTVGKMQMVYDDWMLIMYYNLTNYWEGTRRTRSYFDNLKNICYQSKLLNCRTTIEQLEHELDLLTYYNTILLNPHKHLSDRRKRGLVDGIGYVANSLFGILDQHFAQKYEEDINTIQDNENYLWDLIKNQTSIVELQNKVLKKNEENILRQFQLIDSFVNQTNMNLASIESEMEVFSVTTYINSGSLTTLLLINSLKTFQEMLFNTLTNVYQGHIDVHLITPVHLIQQLDDITASLPKTVSLPVPNYRENIRELYKLIRVKARVTENYFLVETHIPLVSNEDFTIYQAIPLPLSITHNKSNYVATTSKYIAVNLHKNVYISLSEDDLKQCLPQTTNYLCRKSLTSFNLHSDKAACEAKLLSHQNTAPCDVKRASCKDAWIELHSPNSWLAICCDKCMLRTVCFDDVTSYTITSSSIVQLSQGCELQAKDLTIHAHRQFNSNVKMNYEFKVPTIDSSINKIINITYYRIPLASQPEHTESDISAIENKIASQKVHESGHLEISSHDVHQYVISYVLLASAIVSFCVVVWRKRCRRNAITNTQQKATSVQRVHEEIELQVIPTINHRYEREPAPTPATSNTEPAPARSQASCKTGTRNIAFTFD